MLSRKAVGIVVFVAILACAASLLVGAPEGRRFGYQILTAHSAGLSWLVIVVVLAVAGVPLATFILRDQLLEWNRRKARFESRDREQQPVLWWLLLWTYLALFLVILGGLFIFSR
jgi:H+/Cl- antiporter ClcA